MNKAQIKAELRRSACCDDDPYFDCEDFAFVEARGFSIEELADLTGDEIAILYLFVAEAL